MNRLIQPIVLSCLKAGRLTEKSQASHLSWSEKWQLRLHLSLCDGCNEYRKQSLLLGALIEKRLKINPIQFTDQEVDQFTERTLQKLS